MVLSESITINQKKPTTKGQWPEPIATMMFKWGTSAFRVMCSSSILVFGGCKWICHMQTTTTTALAFQTKPPPKFSPPDSKVKGEAFTGSQLDAAVLAIAGTQLIGGLDGNGWLPSTVLFKRGASNGDVGTKLSTSRIVDPMIFGQPDLDGIFLGGLKWQRSNWRFLEKPKIG